MKTIEELNSLTFAIPCPFGKYSDSVSDFPIKGSDVPGETTSWEFGFPQKYALESSDLLRSDLNGFGEMATRELHFKEAGGYREYDAVHGSEIKGYPLHSILKYYDGIFTKNVESQITENSFDYIGNPNLIDSLTEVETDDGIEKKVVWKTVDRISAIADDLLRLNVDFSRCKNLVPGDKLDEDSLIAIGTVYYPSGYDTLPQKPLSVSVMCKEGGLSLSNKGRCGLSAHPPEYIAWIPTSYPYPNELCGTGNYCITFFAKKGDTILCNASGSAVGNIFAFPIVRDIGA